MLSNIAAQATAPVKKLAATRPFYEQTLGLAPIESGEASVMAFRTGSGSILVYESEFAGTNRATAVTWALGDQFDAVVSDLRSKGVTFERYDMPGMTDRDGVYSNGEMKVAWFKDPDGNIFNIGDYAA